MDPESCMSDLKESNPRLGCDRSLSMVSTSIAFPLFFSQGKIAGSGKMDIIEISQKKTGVQEKGHRLTARLALLLLAARNR